MNSSSFWELLYEKYLLNDSIIEDEIEFPNSYPQGTYTINNCAFLNQVSFNDFESEVIFEKCNFKKEILIKSSRPVLKLTFNSCEFLSIDGIPNALINRLNIKNEYNLTFLSKAKINTKVNLIEISNTDFIGLLVLYPNACIISNSKIERLQAYQSQSLKIIDTSIHSSLLSECKNLVTINNSSFKDLQITFSACSLDVQDSTVNNFSLINYNKNKSFLIKNTSITNLIKLKDSNIDDGTFRNCDFSTANMIVEDTNLFNTQFDAIFWKSRSFILDNIMSKKYNNKIDRIDYMRFVCQ